MKKAADDSAAFFFGQKDMTFSTNLLSFLVAAKFPFLYHNHKEKGGVRHGCHTGDKPTS